MRSELVSSMDSGGRPLGRILFLISWGSPSLTAWRNSLLRSTLSIVKLSTMLNMMFILSSRLGSVALVELYFSLASS